MSKRDPLRHYMDIIDNMLAQLVLVLCILKFETKQRIQTSDFINDYLCNIWNLILSQFREDPSFKPQGGRLGENDMDYDTDEKSMATLRRHLRGTKEEYYRYKR